MLSNLTKKQFLYSLKQQPNEDYNIFNDQKYVLSFAKEKKLKNKALQKGSKVVLLLSGGADSITTWYILLKKYELDVYPICLNLEDSAPITEYIWKMSRGRITPTIGFKQWSVVNYFYTYFSQILPREVIAPVYWNQSSFLSAVQEETRNFIDSANIHQQLAFVAQKLDQAHRSQVVFPSPIMFYQASMMYFRFLENIKNIPTTAVIVAVLPSDGHGQKAQTLTTLKMSQELYRYLFDKPELVFFSLPYDDTLGHWWDKSTLVKFAYNEGLPIHETWTCHHSKGVLRGKHCGSCFSCKARKQAFIGSMTPDLTHYI